MRSRHVRRHPAHDAESVARADEALRRAAALGWGGCPDGVDIDIEGELRLASTALLGELRDMRRSDADPAEIASCVADLQDVYLALTDARITDRIAAHERVQEGLDRLRSVSEPSELLGRVSREVCASCGFERGVLSTIDGAQWVLREAHFEDNERWARDFVSFGETARPELTYMMLEAEMARRRAPAIVIDAYRDDRTFKPFVEHSEAACYVGAPIVVRGKVGGFFHADYRFSERPVDETDVQTLWAFAEGFSHIYERAVLLQRLREQRERVGDALAATQSVMSDLTDADIWHGRRERKPATSAARALVADTGRAPWTLTQREVDVLGLLAEGATNADVARSLFIAEGTVKSHVKRILRKMHASNRADAVARFLRYKIEEQAS